MQGLSQVVVKNEEAALAAFFQGTQARAEKMHVLNAHSSRSHCVFTLTLEATNAGGSSDAHATVSKINLVDLAGSERSKKTGVSGDLMTEAQYINKSLTFLEQVVQALVKKQSHVPFRQSKLTAVLRDALGGNARAAMIANIWPEKDNVEEVMSTLRFGSRLRLVENEVVINESKDVGFLLKKQERLIRELRQELAMRDALAGRGVAGYEDLSERDVQELQDVARSFLEGRLAESEVPTDTLKRVKELYTQMKNIFLGMKGKLENAIAEVENATQAALASKDAPTTTHTADDTADSRPATPGTKAGAGSRPGTPGSTGGKSTDGTKDKDGGSHKGANSRPVSATRPASAKTESRPSTAAGGGKKAPPPKKLSKKEQAALEKAEAEAEAARLAEEEAARVAAELKAAEEAKAARRAERERLKAEREARKAAKALIPSPAELLARGIEPAELAAFQRESPWGVKLSELALVQEQAALADAAVVRHLAQSVNGIKKELDLASTAGLTTKANALKAEYRDRFAALKEAQEEQAKGVEEVQRTFERLLKKFEQWTRGEEGVFLGDANLMSTGGAWEPGMGRMGASPTRSRAGSPTRGRREEDGTGTARGVRFDGFEEGDQEKAMALKMYAEAQRKAARAPPPPVKRPPPRP